VAAVVPELRVFDAEYNSKKICESIFDLASKNVQIAVFPELCMVGVTCFDLFKQSDLIFSVEKQITELLNKTRDTKVICVIGAPLKIYNKIINSAIIFQSGNILGVVPKRKLSEVEKRYFCEFNDKSNCVVSLCEQKSIIGDIDFLLPDNYLVKINFGLDISQEANLNLNLCGNAFELDNNFDELIIKSKCIENNSSCAFVNAGIGESSTDFVYIGNAFICEHGNILSRTEEFKLNAQTIIMDLDLESCNCLRVVNNSEAININLAENNFITRKFSRDPFLDEIYLKNNSNLNINKEKCDDYLLKQILCAQRNAIITRFKATRCEKLFVGVSGGIDSCLTLLDSVFVMDSLNISRENIFGITMPGFGTSDNTFSNAEFLINNLGISTRKISIEESCKQHFKDIAHDLNETNTTFENAQARERTQILFDLANEFNGLVLGTGDMTEEATGFTTYNGDHISNYNPNSNITKTIIRKLISYIIKEKYFSEEINSCLNNILSTPVSPELLPPDENGKSSQKTENIMGSCELNDFFIYYVLKYGYSKEKIIFMAGKTFEEYSQEQIKDQFELFYNRFLSQQFKRSCASDGPQIFSFGFSPRGSFMMPSDIFVNKK
jgi:NAD+ synthase (glutamine-hydrolysing)